MPQRTSLDLYYDCHPENEDLGKLLRFTCAKLLIADVGLEVKGIVGHIQNKIKKLTHSSFNYHNTMK